MEPLRGFVFILILTPLLGAVRRDACSQECIDVLTNPNREITITDLIDKFTAPRQPTLCAPTKTVILDKEKLQISPELVEIIERAETAGIPERVILLIAKTRPNYRPGGPSTFPSEDYTDGYPGKPRRTVKITTTGTGEVSLVINGLVFKIPEDLPSLTDEIGDTSELQTIVKELKKLGIPIEFSGGEVVPVTPTRKSTQITITKTTTGSETTTVVRINGRPFRIPEDQDKLQTYLESRPEITYDVVKILAAKRIPVEFEPETNKIIFVSPDAPINDNAPFSRKPEDDEYPSIPRRPQDKESPSGPRRPQDNESPSGPRRPQDNEYTSMPRRPQENPSSPRRPQENPSSPRRPQGNESPFSPRGNDDINYDDGYIDEPSDEQPDSNEPSIPFKVIAEPKNKITVIIRDQPIVIPDQISKISEIKMSPVDRAKVVFELNRVGIPVREDRGRIVPSPNPKTPTPRVEISAYQTSPHSPKKTVIEVLNEKFELPDDINKFTDFIQDNPEVTYPVFMAFSKLEIPVEIDEVSGEIRFPVDDDYVFPRGEELKDINNRPRTPGWSRPKPEYEDESPEEVSSEPTFGRPSEPTSEPMYDSMSDEHTDGEEYQIVTTPTGKILIRIHGHELEIPRDVEKLNRLVTGPHLISIVDDLRSIGTPVAIKDDRAVINQNQPTSYRIQIKVTSMNNKPTRITITVNNEEYNLPEDADRFQLFMDRQPTLTFKIFELLASRKIPIEFDNKSKRIRILVFSGQDTSDQPYTISTNPNGKMIITVKNQQLEVPRDLERLSTLVSTDYLSVIIKELESFGAPVTLKNNRVVITAEPKTAYRIAVKVSSMNGKPTKIIINVNQDQYTLPEDGDRFQQFIHREPELTYKIFQLLAERKVPIEFDNVTKQMRIQFSRDGADPATTIAINGVRYALPQDNQRLATAILSGSVNGNEVEQVFVHLGLKVPPQVYQAIITARTQMLKLRRTGDEIDIVMGQRTLKLPADALLFQELLSNSKIPIEQLRDLLLKVGIESTMQGTSLAILLPTQVTLNNVQRSPSYTYTVTPQGSNIIVKTLAGDFELPEDKIGLTSAVTGGSVLPISLAEALGNSSVIDMSTKELLIKLKSETIRIPLEIASPLHLDQKKRMMRMKMSGTPGDMTYMLELADGTTLTLPEEMDNLNRLVTQKKLNASLLVTLFKNLKIPIVLDNTRSHYEVTLNNKVYSLTA